MSMRTICSNLLRRQYTNNHRMTTAIISKTTTGGGGTSSSTTCYSCPCRQTKSMSSGSSVSFIYPTNSNNNISTYQSSSNSSTSERENFITLLSQQIFIRNNAIQDTNYTNYFDSIAKNNSTNYNNHTICNYLFDVAIWYIKRTFQPSIIRKKRKTGFLVRQRTVGGRRTLNRRRAKGRWRLGGGI